MKALELAFKQEVYVGGTLGFDSAAELRRLAKVNAELINALARVSTCISMHKRYKHIGDGYLEEAQEIIAEAKGGAA